MSRVVAVANQKGGVGKTTSAINIAAALARTKRKVLLIDLDSQANLTLGVGLTPDPRRRGIYDVLLGNATLNEVILKNEAGFDVVVSARNLSGAQVELLTVERREHRLKDAIDKLDREYNWILLDCPPSLNILAINALVAADSVVVPTQCEYYALQGLVELLETIKTVKRNFNPALRLDGILRTMHDKRNKLDREVSNELGEYFSEQVYRTIIPRNIRLAEAPSHGKSVMDYDKNCTGSIAYMAFVGELLSRESVI